MGDVEESGPVIARELMEISDYQGAWKKERKKDLFCTVMGSCIISWLATIQYSEQFTGTMILGQTIKKIKFVSLLICLVKTLMESDCQKRRFDKERFKQVLITQTWIPGASICYGGTDKSSK